MISYWHQRKHEIGTAFRAMPYLPTETDADIYETYVRRTGVGNNRDLCILIAIVRDAIMMARREERPTTPLETFLDWLEAKRDRRV